MHKKLSSKGFSAAILLLVLVVIIALGFASWYVWHNNKTAVPTPKTSTTTTDPYADWKTYSSQTYGVTFKYPHAWTVEEVPTTNPSGADPIEFAANIKLDTNEKYNGTAQFEVHDSSIATLTQLYDKNYAQSPSNIVDKKELTLKGKEAVAYIVTNSGVQSRLYMFNLGGKTYEFGSNNEELNLQRSSAYWSDFDKTFQSLTIR